MIDFENYYKLVPRTQLILSFNKAVYKKSND